MQTMTSQRFLMPDTISRMVARSGDGRPVAGSRPWMWTAAAPACQAPTASSMICCGVSGRYGDILGVWMPPVMAAVMMVLAIV